MKTTPLFRVSLVLLAVSVVATLFGDLPRPWGYIVVGASIVGFMVDILRTVSRSSRRPKASSR